MNFWLAVILIITFVMLFKKRGDICSVIGKLIYARGKSDKWKFFIELSDKIGGINFSNRLMNAYLILKEGDPDTANKKFVLLSMEKLTREQKIQLKGSHALVYWKRGEVKEAIEMLEEVVEVAPSTSVYGSLGYMYIYNGQLSKALEFNQTAYEYNSDDAIIVDNLALTYYKTGDFTNAQKFYEELMTKNPTFPEAYFGYGQLLIEIGDRERGLALVKEALSKNFSFLTMITRAEIHEFIEKNEQQI